MWLVEALLEVLHSADLPGTWFNDYQFGVRNVHFLPRASFSLPEIDRAAPGVNRQRIDDIAKLIFLFNVVFWASTYELSGPEGNLRECPCVHYCGDKIKLHKESIEIEKQE